ncbi:MAG TPA: hypothetical protein VNT79_02810 [Phycisphaerae bacterium]|nr:hypothetical protein [Phycisphaerae bacterium]
MNIVIGALQRGFRRQIRLVVRDRDIKRRDGRIKIPKAYVCHAFFIGIGNEPAALNRLIGEATRLRVPDEPDVCQRVSIVFKFDGGEFGFNPFGKIDRMIARLVTSGPDFL